MALLPFPQQRMVGLRWPSDLIEYFQQLDRLVRELDVTTQRLDIPATAVTGTGGSEQTLLTAPATGSVRLMALWVNNTSGSARTITINLVPSGGSVATGNEVVSDLSVAVGEQKLALTDLALANGAKLELAASAASTLNVFGWYQVVT